MKFSQKQRDRATLTPAVFILDEPGVKALQDDPWACAVYVSASTGEMTTTFSTGFGIDLGHVEMIIVAACDQGRFSVQWRVFAIRDGSNFRHHLTNPHAGTSRTLRAAYEAVVAKANEVAAMPIPAPGVVMKLAKVAMAEEAAAVEIFIANGRVPGPADRSMLQ